MAVAGLVHIIDDDEAVRRGLGSLIQSVGNDTRLYGSANEFLETDVPAVPSCILLDVRLPGTNGLDFQDLLRQRGVRLPVIIITGFGDIQMSVRGMKAGAVDFLTKPLRHQDVLDAVSMALARDRDRRSEDAEVLAIRDRYEKLTPREREVFSLVTSGKMNKQMAATLQISVITVKIHRSAVMKKMAARSIADIVKMAEVLRTARTRGRLTS